MQKTLGQKVKEAREEAKLTITETAKRAKVHHKTISNLEAGKSYPRNESAVEIFKVLGMDTQEMLKVLEDERKPRAKNHKASVKEPAKEVQKTAPAKKAPNAKKNSGGTGTEVVANDEEDFDDLFCNAQATLGIYDMIRDLSMSSLAVVSHMVHRLCEMEDRNEALNERK